MAHAYIGLGANLGDRTANIKRALTLLNQSACSVQAMSAVYETEPWGLIEQPRFLNAACLVETNLSPLALLDTLKRIERSMGRIETVRYGPRPIDLDILLYDDLLIDTPRLTIPHPGMLKRSTVLIPLADIAPTERHPLTGCTILEHLCLLGPAPDVAAYPPGFGSPSSDLEA